MKLEIFYPEKAFPELYADVMRLHIFSDSKTFSDASLLSAVDEINSSYASIDHADPGQVTAFVREWFRIPELNRAPPALEALPIDHHIRSLWPHLIRPSDKPQYRSSLIPLPYPYVVPGGRFREIYYWDSYFTMLGLQLSGRADIIRDMIKNFGWQLDQFGHIPNGNRSYFLSRSQPPFFSLMINLLADIDGPEIYREYFPHLLREYSFWMDGEEHGSHTFRRVVKVNDDQFLNRYFDDSDTPRAESYAEDVELAGSGVAEAKAFYRHLKAACESGWDFSSRWLSIEKDLRSIATLDIIPVDLNALIYILERTIARAYLIKGDDEMSLEFEMKANKRALLIQNLLWNEEDGYFSDLLFKENKYGIPSLAMMYPLFAGIATPDQAKQTITFITEHFLKPGGWVTSNQYTGQQWDAPNGWAPLQWITYEGLKKYGADTLANEAAQR
ncbi:MAG: trehalase family glycosidase, partial [Saprospiraceae bacterium]